MNLSNFGILLSRIGEAAHGFGPAVPGKAGTVIGGIGSGLALVGDLFAVGQDPSVHIDAVRSLDSDLTRIRAAREIARRAAIAEAQTKTR
jgi:hypothetical protein